MRSFSRNHYYWLKNYRLQNFKEHTFAFFKTGLFSIGSIDYKDYSHLRVTLDYEEDYLVISAIANEMVKILGMEADNRIFTKQ